MSRVWLSLSMSLDGYVTGPDPGPGQPPGAGGERLHEWAYGLQSRRARHGLPGGEADSDSAVLEEAMDSAGALVMGRAMFDAGEGPWGEQPPFRVPVFVVTHRPREPVTRGSTTFTFVTHGVPAAILRARAAGRDKDVMVAGGVDVARQALAAGLLDELQIHLVPVLLGGGVPLFDAVGPAPVELEPLRIIASRAVTHLKYRVL